MNDDQKKQYLTSIGSRIRAVRLDQGMSQDELAKKSGYGSRSTINKIELGINDIPQSKIRAIAQALGVSVSQILCGDEPDTPKDDDLFAIPGILPVPPMVRKPLIGTIACGTPILAEQNIDKFVAVPEDIHCDFALRCEGDSMIGIHIMPGAAVYIREQPDVENGEVAAVIVDDETATLKKIYKTDSTITLLAENPAYPPIIITGERLQHVRILGVVVAWTNYL